LAAPEVDLSEPPRSRADRLCAELQSSWSILAGLIERLSEATVLLRTSTRRKGSLRGTGEEYERDTRVLLVEPAEQFLRSRLIRRSLEAIQKYDQETSRGTSAGRARLDSRFQRLLARTAIDLGEPWRIQRRGNHEDEWIDWDERRSAHLKESTGLFERYARWARNVKEDARGKDKRRESRYVTWWRQDRAVTALLEMEVSFRELQVAWFAATEDFALSISREREEILSRAGQTMDWIQAGAETVTTAPVEVPEIASPDERLRVWSHSIERDAVKRLPEHVELAIIGLVTRWRSVAVRDTFLKAFSTRAQPPMREVIEHYWSQSAGVVREIARAREIVDHWRGSPADSGNDGTLFADARHNAATMLAEQANTPLAVEELEAKLVDAFWTWTEKGFTSIEAAQFGWFRLLQRPGGRRLAGRAVRSGKRRGRAAAQLAGRWASTRWDRILELAGGKVPAQPKLPPVVRRTTLRDTLSLPASKGELPKIYGLLFRIAPVEDRRFLVGRNRELAGLQQALKDWEAGRFAACLLVGDRGSGKTSLLNCAEKEAFVGHQLIRGQFGERALCQEEIDGFLRRLLGLNDRDDLEAAFAAERRILVIEECERIYLRKVGGFAGTLYLINLIHRTAPTTFWVIVMNDKAFRVLDAGVHLHRVFSHRINAMNVSREDLENAILERHRLSGLRLQFALPPAGDPRLGRVKKLLGLHESPQKLFFDSLFQQSEGVFRSAFELWLSSIERVEGENVKIRQPLDPAFSKFRSELSQEDHFTVLAIQEHGSLTQDELAEVLCENPHSSRSRLDRLFALGLIEPDPEHPGLRVRPEAQRFANDLLRRANFT
jgi:AAA ATPase domain